MTMSTTQAEIVLHSKDLAADMAFLISLGFRLHQIYPSDNPSVARMSGHGLSIRLDCGAQPVEHVIHLLTDEPERFPEGELRAPNGTLFKLVPKAYTLKMPQTQHQFEVRRLRDKAPWVIGRAGMLYRDLVPNRLGGSIIASHIRIPDGGPVPDMVHYHTIGFQLIYCYKGWVKLVYEDQGPPFVLRAGDCVTQPPEIRHRVLEASDALEVIEIGVPSDHMTTIDHDMELPNGEVNPEREFQGQVFCHHQLESATWQPWLGTPLEFRDTGIGEATRGEASVKVFRPAADTLRPFMLRHESDIWFAFVLEGELSLEANGATHALQAGDAFVLPPDFPAAVISVSHDLELLEVVLPAN